MEVSLNLNVSEMRLWPSSKYGCGVVVLCNNNGHLVYEKQIEQVPAKNYVDLQQKLLGLGKDILLSSGMTTITGKNYKQIKDVVSGFEEGI